MKKDISQKQFQKKVLKQNPGINQKLVRLQQELEEELKKLGVDTKYAFFS